MYMQIDPLEAWERLRASRSSRPGRASGGARAKTYATALEQAQQMFKAAEVVGPQTRPLLVFYGLSQAGRAIAAAAVDLKGEDWNLTSHGIHASGYHLDFADIEIRTDPAGTAGSFVRLSKLLRSPVWGNDTVVRLEEVWDTLPANLQYPLTGRERFTPLYASTDPIANTDFHPLLTLHVGDILDRVVDNGSRTALDEFLQSYPGTAGYEEYARRRTGTDAEPDYVRHHPDAGWLYMHWKMPAETGTKEERLERLSAMTRSYAGHRYFFPAVAGLPCELHPLMAWWAVLYALSMLARYQPAQWANHINVDGSRHAVPIEKILERAMEHLPVLIADTIEEVAAWP
ncbi:YaaC family protein (plasmid) [Streptomyces sp. NBC_00111]|uniref:YaaC family protein n=1 Tax=Streptomyces sp. NBC_00111 TaxID=2975655 RepID=UPI002F90B613